MSSLANVERIANTTLSMADKHNYDAYTRTAMERYKVSAEAVTHAMRERVKAANFGALYGLDVSAIIGVTP